MALRITQSRSAERAKNYFKESLRREDYYTEDREITGTWGGSGAEKLGLRGAVEEKDFFALTENVNPATADRLTQRTRANRRVGYDLTFSVPKSISLHQALLDHPDIEDAFESAVADTMKAMEQDMYARVRRQGAFSERKTGNMLWAGFTHFTARPVEGKGADPHLHKHVFAFNATFDETEGCWKAGEFGHLHLKRPYWEAAFHSRFSENLRGMGYDVERTAHNFELKSYRRETLDKYAQRTKQIEAAAREKGVFDAERKAQLGARTRAGKEKGTTADVLRSDWWGRLTQEEVALVQQVESRRGGSAREDKDSLPALEPLRHAIDESFERKSVVTRHQFLTSMLKAGVDRKTVEQIHGEFEAAAEAGALIVADWEGEPCVTTPEIQREEERMLAYARETQGLSTPFLDDTESLPPSRTERRRPADWDAAARSILGSRDRVTMLIGKPGSGKTTVMQTVADALTSQGLETLAFAPSSNASRENQRRAGFGNAETLAMLFASESLQERARGQVIWVDEAGMIGARDMCRLFDLSEKLGARVIMTGDPNQHKPVDRGDAMRVLEEFGQVEPTRLNIIRRQVEDEYRQAATEISEGRIAEGFDRLVNMGAVREVENWEERAKTVAEDYARVRIDEGKSALVVSPTHVERKQVSEEIRAELQRRNVVAAADRRFLRWENRGWQTSQKRDPVCFRSGDKVKFHKAAAGFAAGASATVLEREGDAVWVEVESGDRIELPLEHADRFDVFEEGEIDLAVGDEIRITRNGFAKSTDPSGRKQRLSNGRVYRLDSFTEDGDLVLQNGFVVDSKYASLDYGYVVTSHTSQSLDEDVVLVAQGHASFPASNAEQFLVSVTRGKEAVRIYTDDRDGLQDVIQRSGARVSALELLAGQERQPQDALVVGEAERSRLTRVREWVLAIAHRFYDQSREKEGDIGRSARELERRGEQNVSGPGRRL